MDFLCQRCDVSRLQVTVYGNFVMTSRTGINLMLARGRGTNYKMHVMRRFSSSHTVHSTVYSEFIRSRDRILFKECTFEFHKILNMQCFSRIIQ